MAEKQIPMCTKCGENTAMIRRSGHTNGVCAKCMQANSAAKRRAEMKIDFTGHLELLEKIRAAAEAEFRPLNMQILYTLKRGMAHE